MGIVELIVVIALVVGVYLFWRSRQTRVEGDQRTQALLAQDVAGCTGVVASDRLDEADGRVRLTDRAGVTRVLPARLDEAAEPMVRGQEVLVLENAGPDGRVVVAPSDLPGLEDLS